MTLSRAILFDTLFMIRLLSWLVTTLTCSWSRSDSDAHAAGANGRLFRARTRHHGDLACHGACLFNMADDWQDPPPGLCAGCLRGGKEAARDDPCAEISACVSSRRRGGVAADQTGGRSRAASSPSLARSLLRNACMLTLMEINRALNRLGVGAFIPRTLAAHVAAGCVPLDREPETTVLLLSPGVRSTCRSGADVPGATSCEHDLPPLELRLPGR